MPQLQERELAAALAPYATGSLGHLLDSDRDDVGGDEGNGRGGGSYQVFELKRLIDMEDQVLLPVLLYLFHRLGQEMGSVGAGAACRDLGVTPTLRLTAGTAFLVFGGARSSPSTRRLTERTAR